MTVFTLTLRSLLSRRRTIALALVALAPAAFLSLRLAFTSDALLVYTRVMERIFLSTSTAFVALVLGVSALGDQREDGTILYLAATPLKRVAIAAQAGLAAWAATLLLVGPSAVICIAVSGKAAPAFAIWTLLAVVLVSGAYVAAFGWLALRTRRPVIFGFLYILLWEGSIATFAASANRLSIAAYGRAVLARAVPDAPRFNVPSVGAGAGAVVLAAVIVLGVGLAARAFARAELP
jgi:ABC-type transport system involved in multi-copper enzyme maturation permease subunit